MEKVTIERITSECGAPNNNKLFIIDDIKKCYNETAPKQVLLEGFIFAFIIQGNARIIIDDEEYDLQPGDCFGCNPRHVLERSMMSMDLKIMGFFVTEEYTSKILHNLQVDWSFLMMAKTHEKIHVNDEEMDRLMEYTELLRKKLAAPESKYKEDSIVLLIKSMGLEIFDIRERQSQLPHQTDFSPRENMIQRFMMMLAESRQKGKPYLNVNGYAERLNVSAKYFSLVCKNILGKTASEVINEDIINTANVLLHDNSMSIKQISDRLGFANQSHFGTFYRRHSGGKSPQEVRRNQ